MTTPKNAATRALEVELAYRADVLTGSAPGLTLADLIETALVEAVEAEREACAAVALSKAPACHCSTHEQRRALIEELAAAIRARKEQQP